MSERPHADPPFVVRRTLREMPAIQVPGVDRKNEPGPMPEGELIALFGCRGGAGATTLATHLAGQFGRAGRSVCLVDLDLQMGDVLVSLDVEQSVTLAHIARDMAVLTGPILEQKLYRHSDGFHVLSQVDAIDQVDQSLLDKLPALIAWLRTRFEVVIVDGIRDYSDSALAALDAASRVLLLVPQDVPSVRRAGRAIFLWRKLGYEQQRLSLVVRNADRGVDVPEEELTRALQLPIFARIRHAPEATRKAQDWGQLCTTGRLAADVASLAQRLLPKVAAPAKAAGAKTSRSRWFGLGRKEKA